MPKGSTGQVYGTIYAQSQTTKQAVAAATGLSLPTVAACLKELEAEGLIRRQGHLASSGGRPPQALACVADSRVALGAEITKNHLTLVCTDLYGRVLARQRQRLPYENSAAYYADFGARVTAFAGGLPVEAERILGVGIAVQGLVAPDGSRVTYGEILGSTGARLESFAAAVPWPCRLIHDSEAAAFAELWLVPGLRNAVYLTLGRNLGSALILDGAVHRGEGIGSGLVEHMVLRPGGCACYCGKAGCLEAYCSAEALCGGERHLDEFFTALKKGSRDETARWRQWLEDLSAGLDNLHMVLDCDVILGGAIAAHMMAEDFLRLNALALERCAFPETRAYIRAAQAPQPVVAVGAAMGHVARFVRGE